MTSLFLGRPIRKHLYYFMGGKFEDLSKNSSDVHGKEEMAV